MAAAQQRYYETVLDYIRADRYPSGELMDRLEATISTPEQVDEYLEVLFDNVQSCRYPSKQMLDRIARLAY
jgi:hypothetical protein